MILKAYIGGFRALIDSPALKGGGFGSWVLWNGAYLTSKLECWENAHHFTVLLSVKNKIMVNWNLVVLIYRFLCIGSNPLFLEEIFLDFDEFVNKIKSLYINRTFFSYQQCLT